MKNEYKKKKVNMIYVGLFLIMEVIEIRKGYFILELNTFSYIIANCSY